MAPTIINLTDDTDSDSGSDIVYPSHRRSRPHRTDKDSDPGVNNFDAATRSEAGSSDPQAEHDLLMACFDKNAMSDYESDTKGFRELLLKDFVIYKICDDDDDSVLISSLDLVASNIQTNCGAYRFDGTLLCEKTGREAHVKNIAIADVQIEYQSCNEKNNTNTNDKSPKAKHNHPGESSFSTRSKIWIVSPRSRACGQCYYRLSSEPAIAYREHFENFVWLTDFTRLVFEYLEYNQCRQTLIGLSNFEKDFYRHTKSRYSCLQAFRNWYQKGGSSQDFRRQITCAHHAEFIFDQIYNIQKGLDKPDCGQSSSSIDSDCEMSDAVAGIDSAISIRGSSQLLPLFDHPIWKDIGQDPTRLEEDSTDTEYTSEISEHDHKLSPTTVTPKVADCFLRAFPSWGPKKHNLLRVERFSDEVKRHCISRRTVLDLADKYARCRDADFIVISGNGRQHKTSIILAQAAQQPARASSWNAKSLVGKAITIKCKNGDKYAYRYAYVRGLTRGQLSVIWLFTPEQTSLGTSFYPIGNELFFTDECMCKAVSPTLVVSLHTMGVDKGKSASQDRCELFAYQLYKVQEQSFHDINIDRIEACLCCHPAQPTLCTSANPRQQGPIMETVSCFSGGGLLDYAMRQGSSGTIRTIYTAETDSNAVRSIVANCPLEELYPGIRRAKDVNDELTAWMTGRQQFPNADCFVAGFPCIGFTILNRHSDKEKGQRMRSTVALTLSVIEVLLPKMILLENVPAINAKPKPGQTTAAEQALSFLVSLGYQAKLCEVTASSLGAATTRRRLFIVASMPGIPLPNTPEATHGPGTSRGFTTAAQVTSDLPSLENDTGLCAKYPDHKPIKAIRPFLLSMVKKIPKVDGTSQRSEKMPNLYQCRAELNQEEQDWYAAQREGLRQESNDVLRRIDPRKPYGTITTRLELLNTRGSRCIHWDQDRMASLEELRRYHGVPKEYLLIGNLQAQLRQLGNSVAHNVGYAWGREFYLSWQASRSQDTTSVQDEQSDDLPHASQHNGTEGNVIEISSDEDE